MGIVEYKMLDNKQITFINNNICCKIIIKSKKII